MNKNEFLKKLAEELHGIPKSDIDKTLDYYSEIIDDAVEEGEDERTVIERLGSVGEIAEKIIDDMPLARLVKENIKRRKWDKAMIVLIIVGSPIWFSLLISALSVIASVYLSLWAMIIALWSVFAALAVSGPVCLVGAATLIAVKPLKAMYMLGTAFMCMGIAVFMFYISWLLTKLLIKLTLFAIRKTKSAFIKRGGGEYEGK